MSAENIEKFINKLAQSLHKETFVKMTLGNYKGEDQHLQKLLVRLIRTKKGVRLFFLFRYDIRDTVKNFSFTKGIELIRGILGSDFYAGHLFTTENDFQLDIGKKGRSRLNTAKSTFTVKPDIGHDKKKSRLVDQDSFYLKALGITTDVGEIRTKQYDKWKQINKFVETLSKFVENSLLKDKKQIRIVDMGSGKGYLTFATYDYFRNQRGIDVQITGVDTKQQLVELCNGIAKSCDFENLQFINGSIDNFNLDETDILIALHACNTATDDAIFKGIHAKAGLIVVAPCCHQEIRPQIKTPAMFENVLKHGVLIEREAESVTDGLRSLLLEKNGYSSKIFEFIATEHTPKNNMIVGTRLDKTYNIEEFENQIQEIKVFFGIKSHRLETLLNKEFTK